MISANNVFGWAALSYFFPPRSTCRLSTWWISCRLIRLARPSSGHEPMQARLDLFLCLWNGIISACQFAILFTRGFTSSHLSRFVWSAWPNCGEKCVTSKKTRLTIGSNLTNEKISWDTNIEYFGVWSSIPELPAVDKSDRYRLVERTSITLGCVVLLVPLDLFLDLFQRRWWMKEELSWKDIILDVIRRGRWWVRKCQELRALLLFKGLGEICYQRKGENLREWRLKRAKVNLGISGCVLSSLLREEKQKKDRGAVLNERRNDVVDLPFLFLMQQPSKREKNVEKGKKPNGSNTEKSFQHECLVNTSHQRSHMYWQIEKRSRRGKERCGTDIFHHPPHPSK